jgi:hypothetical protein
VAEFENEDVNSGAAVDEVLDPKAPGGKLMVILGTPGADTGGGMND